MLLLVKPSLCINDGNVSLVNNFWAFLVRIGLECFCISTEYLKY